MELQNGRAGNSAAASAEPRGKALFLLALGALGIVYGDIGTSPLYAMRECFSGSHSVPVTRTNVFGILSLVFWAVTLIVTLKYLWFVLRADNQGEGGILSLLSIALPEVDAKRKRRAGAMLTALGIFGAALLYGDGIITPAISVLGAIEGLEVATPALKPFVVPITAVILVVLFSTQRVGTAGVARIFGPVTLVWFITIGALGLASVVKDPEVLAAVSPTFAFSFFAENRWHGFAVLGAVFLVVTGAEALYADMGHFGRKPIRTAWFIAVLPALLLNYFGQGALLLRDPASAINPFFRLAPGWFLYPLVMIATSAAIIASQALISGAYSLTMHAIQMGYLTRMRIDHTSSETRGQIYMPHLNWVLMIACVALVIGFRSSSNLAAAYGIAVTLTMMITTVLFYSVLRRRWNWSVLRAAPLCGLFFAVETAFFGANALKIAHGGWFPLVLAAVVFTIMTTWKTGRRILGERLRSSILPVEEFLGEIEHNPPVRVPGTAVFMSSNAGATPLALLHNIKHNRVLHERVVFLTIVTEEVPHVEPGRRVEVAELRAQMCRVIGRYGYMEDPSVPDILTAAKEHGLNLNPMNATYFLSRETIVPAKRRGMALWREFLFAVLSRNAQRPTDYFRIPPNRVVELGMQVEI